jgi:hypothetical protein
MNSHMRFTTGTAVLIGQLHSSDTSKMSPPTSERDGQADSRPTVIHRRSR